MLLKASRLSFLVVWAAAAVPTGALAAGYHIDEHDAKAVGRAGAAIATVDDPSAIYYNPAGLAQVKGTMLNLGITLIRPSITYEGPGYDWSGGQTLVQSANSSFIPIPNLYVGRAITDRVVLGLGVFSPYGLGLDYGTDTPFVGRADIQEISMKTVFLTPSMAVKFHDRVRVGAGVSIVPANLYFRRVLGSPDNHQPLFPAASPKDEGYVELSGSTVGVGANIGVQANLTDELRLGAVYRSMVGFDFSGKANFVLPEGLTTSIQSQFPDGPANGHVEIPHLWAVGIGWVDDSLTLEFTTSITRWRSFEELAINFDSGLPQPTSSSRRDWNNRPTFRLGGQYLIDDYALRLGVIYDLTPVPDSTLDPTLPDSNRICFSAGAGTKFERLSFDLAYMAVILGERSTDASVNFAPGKFRAGIAHVLGASIGLAM